MNYIKILIDIIIELILICLFINNKACPDIY